MKGLRGEGRKGLILAALLLPFVPKISEEKSEVWNYAISLLEGRVI